MDEQQLLEQTKPEIDTGDWLKKIADGERALKKWRTEAAKYISIYEDGKGATDDDGANNLSHFNILFSNTETLRATIYNKPPEPRVVRRFRDANALGGEAADILERATSFQVEEENTDDIVKTSVQEALLTGFSLVRVRYEAKLVQEPVKGMDGMPQLNELGEPVMQDKIAYQEVELENVPYNKIVWQARDNWEKVNWVAFEHEFTPDEMLETFGLEKGSYKETAYKNASGEETERMCKVYEVWDKLKRQVFFIVAGQQEVQKLTDDPLGLEDFYPIPKPMQFLKRNQSTVPLPEYRTYKKQAEKLADAAERKAKIIKYIKATGIYNSTDEQVGSLLKGEEGVMYPVTLASFEGGIDVSKSFAMLPIEGFARVLQQLEATIQESKQIIFELTGISDIMRGQSVASESATAQRIKGNFGTMRVQDRQREVARFVRDIVRLVGEITAEKFEPQILGMIVGKPVSEQVVALLRDQSVRSFTIDIEDNSTIQSDEEADKQNAVEMLTSFGTFLQTIGPMVQPNGMIPFNVAKEMLMIAVRRFKGTRAFEEVLDKWEASVAPPAQMGNAGAPMLPVQNNIMGQ